MLVSVIISKQFPCGSFVFNSTYWQHWSKGRKVWQQILHLFLNFCYNYGLQFFFFNSYWLRIVRSQVQVSIFYLLFHFVAWQTSQTPSFNSCNTTSFISLYYIPVHNNVSLRMIYCDDASLIQRYISPLRYFVRPIYCNESVAHCTRYCCGDIS